jgi:hypothetical protein
MKLPLALVSLMIAAAASHADMVIVQKVDGAGQSGEMTVKVGDTKVRTDVSPQVSMITDTATGDVTTLMHAQKSFMVISASTTKTMIDQMRASMQQSTGASDNPPPAKATGKTDKINGYNAAEYTFANGTMKATFWVSSEFPNAKEVTAAMAKLQKGGLAQMTKGLTPDITTLPGVAVKTEVDMAGQKITTELESAKEETVDPSEYQVPADYTEMKMPAMPGASQ